MGFQLDNSSTGAVGGTFTDNVFQITKSSDTTAKLKFSILSNTAVVTTFVINSSINRTITFPDATTTVVGTDVTQTLTNKTVGLSDGSLAAPGLFFTADTNTGLYRVGMGEAALVASGIAALEFRKSTGAFANIGMGGPASVSDLYPILISRPNASSGTYIQISNPDQNINSKATFQLSCDAGNNTGELSVYSGATTIPPYASSLVLRPSGGATRLTLIGGEAVGGSITTYTNGDFTAAGEHLRFNADKSIQFVQQIATPTTPTVGNKLYFKADGKLYKLSTAGVEESVSSPMTTLGDLIYGGTAGLATRLPKGTDGQVLKLSGGLPIWAAAPGGTYSTPQVSVLVGTGNYTTPANCLYLEVEALGAGGGGSGSGTAAGTAASAGTATTFGTSLISAGGGAAAGFNTGTSTAGGTGSLGTATGLVMNGNGGNAGYALTTSNGLYMEQVAGGFSPIGGNAGAGAITVAGANGGLGQGGWGAGAPPTANAKSGSGGGGGAYVRAIVIPTALQVFAYVVASGPSGGGAGTGGYGGGFGGQGYLKVTAYFQ